jgi:hypothetical protein
MMLYHQEVIFRESFIAAAGLKEPSLPKEQTEKIEKYQKSLARLRPRLLKQFNLLFRKIKSLQGVIGLPEDGERTVTYRYQGDVYEDTAYDINQKSIVVRNLQELGVDSIEALKFLFPEKTDSERAEMLKGFPSAWCSKLNQQCNNFWYYLSQMLQSPHPLAPNQPLAADPRLNITPLLYRTFDHLAEELTYSGSYEPADPSFDPEPGLPGGSPGGIFGPGLNRLPAVGGANSTPAAASVPTAQPPSQVQQATAPSTSNQYNQLTSQSSPSNPWEAAMGSLERVLSQVNSQSLSQVQQSPYQVAPQPATQLSNQSLQAQPWAYQEQQVAPTSFTNALPTQTSSQTSTAPQTSVSPVNRRGR